MPPLREQTWRSGRNLQALLSKENADFFIKGIIANGLRFLSDVNRESACLLAATFFGSITVTILSHITTKIRITSKRYWLNG
jgi:hypothetical protein